MTLPSRTKGEFSVCQFFPGGEYEYVKRWCDLKEAMDTAESFASRPSAMLGVTQRVIITDGGDCTCWEWQFGKGVVFDGRPA